MAIVMGPILGFRGATDGAWRTSALVVTDGGRPPKLRVDGAKPTAPPSQPAQVWAHAGRPAWRVDWAVARTKRAQSVSYAFGSGAAATYVVPPAGAPLRLAYATCNGFSDPKYMKGVTDKNERWKHLARAHGRRACHLLVLGGDQVYGDPIWSRREVPALADWLELGGKARLRAAFTPQMAADVERFYFDLYCQRWSQPEPAAVLASIPSLMMWDDHDIFDGWGSYPDDLQRSAVYQGIFAIARRAFLAFQLQATPDALPAACFTGQDGVGFGYQIDTTAVAALDLRSSRTRSQVMSPRDWNASLEWIDGLSGCRHLLVLASIPVVYPRFGLIEGLLGQTPGEQELEDDLKDHWTSRPHREERVRLVQRLLAFAAGHRCRVTVLSGDVHVAALGCVESARRPGVAENAAVINQLISSAIVHTPPPGVAQYFLKATDGCVEEVDRDITARMLHFAGSDRRFVAGRNWMSLSFDEKDRIWAEWWVEGEQAPYTKVVHPCGDVPEADT